MMSVFKYNIQRRQSKHRPYRPQDIQQSSIKANNPSFLVQSKHTMPLSGHSVGAIKVYSISHKGRPISDSKSKLKPPSYLWNGSFLTNNRDAMNQIRDLSL